VTLPRHYTTIVDVDWLDTLMQWLHLTAAVTGVGGMIYARVVVGPSLAELDPDQRGKIVTRIVARARPLWFGIVVILLGTGLYNYLTRLEGRPSSYHMILGIKMLLALHVFTIGILLSIPPGANPSRDARRPRLLAGAAISGVIILLLSAYLRRNY
jgi:uncharacterized membrane protein